MRITLNKDFYKGTDGSSLSDIRCNQIVLLHNMLKDIEEEYLTYKDIQNLAVEKGIYGSSKADSVIRTYFPLLCKLGFAKCDDYVKKSDIFTESGKRLILLQEALNEVQKSNNQEIIDRLYDVKAKLIQLGIKFWVNTESKKDNNIWLALDLFLQMERLEWNEFLYGIYLWHNGSNTSDIISKIINNRNDGVQYSFFKEDQKPLPDTTYTYIRALLVEAHIIKNINSSTSALTVEGKSVIETIF